MMGYMDLASLLLLAVSFHPITHGPIEVRLHKLKIFAPLM
jgi:hypothetical protein